jgi:primosomal replication protein N
METMVHCALSNRIDREEKDEEREAIQEMATRVSGSTVESNDGGERKEGAILR